MLRVAKLKLPDFLQDHRRLAINKGESVEGEVIIEMLKQAIEDNHMEALCKKCAILANSR